MRLRTKVMAVIIINITESMLNSETKNRRSASQAPRENRQMTILSKEENQWKRTSKIKTSPSATFGKSERNSQEKKQLPGPGAYELNKTTFEKGFVAFKGNKKIRFHTDSPGPGAYQPKHLFPTKRFSFERSEPHDKPEPKPSPATYDLRLEKPNGITFSKEERNLTPEKEKLLLPGPGKYDSSKVFSHKNEFSFTKTKKFFESQHELEEKDVNPGPGAYELSKSRNLIKTAKFARAIRSFLDEDKLPGPGAYNLDRSSLLHRGGIISAEKRSHDYDNNVPGPGNYNDVPINSIKKKEAVVIINRSRENSSQHKKNIPGPGYYFKQKIISDKILGGTIGKDSRSNRKQIIVPNIANPTLFSSKPSNEDYHVEVQGQPHSIFEQLSIDNMRIGE